MDRLHSILIQLQSPIQRIREGARRIPVLTIPFDADTHGKIICLLRRKRLTELTARLTTHHSGSTGHNSQMSITCTIREQISADTYASLLGSLHSSNRNYLSISHFRIHDSITCEKTYIRFSSDDIPFLPILIMMSATCIAYAVRSDFIQDITQ